MIIKKFTGATMREAMEKVKEALGEDAIILKSEKISKGGLLDFSDKKQEYEITAAIDKTPLPAFSEQRLRERVQEKKKAEQTTQERVMDKAFPTSAKVDKRSITEAKNEFLDEIEKKFKVIDLKTDLKKLEDKLDTVADHIKYNEMPSLPDGLVPYYIRLKEGFIDDRIIKDIMMNIYMTFQGADFKNKEKIERAIIKQIAERLNVTDVEEPKRGRGPKVIALVGPTGVGKTTTLAKMAFNPKIYGGKKVGLITADTYRIAAVEQLKTYSNITEIPLEVIYQPEQISESLEKFKDYEIVLVDTAGRSQRNRTQLAELKKILYEGGIIDVYLVLSMTTRNEDQADILKRFSAINFNKIIFTKLDETSGYGSLLNASVNYNIPINMLTFGQNVPDDIEIADKNKIAEMILFPEKINFD